MVWWRAQQRSWSATSAPVAGHPDLVQVGADLDAAADHRRVDRVVVGVQAHVVVARQPQARCASPVAGATGGSASIAARSASIRSAGAQPSTRWCALVGPRQPVASWALKSAGEVNARPGRNEVSR